MGDRSSGVIPTFRKEFDRTFVNSKSYAPGRMLTSAVPPHALGLGPAHLRATRGLGQLAGADLPQEQD